MLIVTSSSIPPRFKYLPKYYANLAKQATRPDKVELWVARNYRRFPGEIPQLPELPDWVDVNWVEDDLGPATKVLPAAQKWRDQDVDIVYCDDDRLYDRNWLTRFVDSKSKFPGMALTESGLTLEQIGLDREVPLPGPEAIPRSRAENRMYRWKRRATLGLHRPARSRYSTAGYVDIAEGFAGVMVRPDWFKDEDFNIPPILWTVDDVWLSGCLLRRGIHIHSTDGAMRPVSYKPSHRSNPLAKHVEDGAGRMDANRACVQYFRDTYGVWL